MQLTEGIAQVLPGRGVVGLERDHLAEGRRRVFKIATLAQDRTQVVQGAGIPGPQGERAAIGGFGLLESAELLEDIAAVVVRVRMIRRQLESAVEVFQGAFRVAKLVLGHAQKMQGVHLLWGVGQDPPIAPGRLVNLALPVVAQGEGQILAPCRAWPGGVARLLPTTLHPG